MDIGQWKLLRPAICRQHTISILERWRTLLKSTMSYQCWSWSDTVDNILSKLRLVTKQNILFLRFPRRCGLCEVNSKCGGFWISHFLTTWQRRLKVFGIWHLVNNTWHHINQLLIRPRHNYNTYFIKTSFFQYSLGNMTASTGCAYFNSLVFTK
jgi:hypothetical protein